MSIIELHIAITQHNLCHENSSKPQSVVDVLNGACCLSKSSLKQAINKGALWLSRDKRTKRLRRLKTPLNINDELHFYYNDEVLAQPIPKAELIADFTDYSVWYKPYGMLSQGSKWSDHCTITRFVERFFENNRACFIVHRLDRAATGLIIVAHGKKSTKALTAMFEAHNFNKYYQIIVAGDFSSSPSPLIINTPIDDKKSLSIFNFNAFDASSNSSLIDVKIETGRKHQIRKHAASINFPVIGDRLHGNNEINQLVFTNTDLQLCAVKLEFTCPLTQLAKKIVLPEHYRPSLSALS